MLPASQVLLPWLTAAAKATLLVFLLARWYLPALAAAKARSLHKDVWDVALALLAAPSDNSLGLLSALAWVRRTAPESAHGMD